MVGLSKQWNIIKHYVSTYALNRDKEAIINPIKEVKGAKIIP